MALVQLPGGGGGGGWDSSPLVLLTIDPRRAPGRWLICFIQRWTFS